MEDVLFIDRLRIYRNDICQWQLVYNEAERLSIPVAAIGSVFRERVPYTAVGRLIAPPLV